MTLRHLFVRSITLRLLISYLMIGLFSLTASWVTLVFNYQSMAKGQFEKKLNIHLKILASAFAEHPGLAPTISHLGNPRFGQLASGWYWQIYSLDRNRVSFISPSLGGGDLPVLHLGQKKLVTAGRHLGHGFAPNGERITIIQEPVYSASGGVYIFTIGAADNEVQAGINQFSTMAFTIIGVSLLWFIATAMLFGRYAIRPLKRLVRDIALIKLGKSDHLVKSYPKEIQPLVDELNGLINAYAEVVQRARTHTGNLAHALKTPLTVLSNEIKALDDQNAARLITQLETINNRINYHLNRGQIAGYPAVLGVNTDIISAAERLCRTLRKLYQKEIIVKSKVTRSARFCGERQDLEEILGNLIDNACKWATAKVTVTIAQGQVGTTIILIEDDGPGLGKEKLQQVLGRGFKTDKDMPGSGLGLAITAELIELYHGQMELNAGADSRGLRVKLVLPCA